MEESLLKVGSRDQVQCLSAFGDFWVIAFQAEKARTVVMYGGERNKNNCHCTACAQQCGGGCSVTDIPHYQHKATSAQMVE